MFLTALKQILAVLIIMVLAGAACGGGSGPVPTPVVTVTSITPASGSTLGGTAVTVAGSNFSGATLTVGGVPATSVVTNSSTSVSGTTGPHNAGKVDVVVTNSNSGGATLPGGFEYLVPVLRAIPGGPYSADAERDVTLSGLASTSTPNSIAHYRWNCGQATGHRVACDQDTPTPTFRYAKTGAIKDPPLVFTITLTIEDTRGSANTATTTISVRQQY
jgi:hypothetical protein